ncbi:hypothetical protein JANAI62_05550 [Jannaschia pagri]|uniref:DUF4166 domain-containing protein n=1 Tax=Jannaschia pagri TaxID=2829797 RepID=A0ABQ4NHP1_9RHOB|nr:MULTISPECIES: DUF4166 domain-containing protein [unclassified Jannaschia]GIT89961.1 hypothetical protein JANAI61_04190 [Jannaschia sp. AI_61]GIT93932.1 hypothetical protein JANAI62_05550 [Jannaschia sp. AI_62]
MTSLYARVMGDAFGHLPTALAHFHGGTGRWSGTAHLRQGSRLARGAARLAGYPDTSGPVPLVLTITADGDTETWQRAFDGHTVTTRQRQAGPEHIAETVGPSTLLMRPTVSGRALTMGVTGSRLGPLPLPPVLHGGGREEADGDSIHFDVTAHVTGIGLLIGYAGTLSPE